MYPDRSVTYVPGLYPTPPNTRMDLPGRGRRIVDMRGFTSLARQVMRNCYTAEN